MLDLIRAWLLPGSHVVRVVTFRACALAALTSYAQPSDLNGPIKQTIMKRQNTDVYSL